MTRGRPGADAQFRTSAEVEAQHEGSSSGATSFLQAWMAKSCAAPWSKETNADPRSLPAPPKPKPARCQLRRRALHCRGTGAAGTQLCGPARAVAGQGGRPPRGPHPAGCALRRGGHRSPWQGEPQPLDPSAGAGGPHGIDPHPATPGGGVPLWQPLCPGHPATAQGQGT